VVKERVTRKIYSVFGLAQMEEETTDSQVGKLAEEFNNFKQE
jgi:hypothetical protein